MSFLEPVVVNIDDNLWCLVTDYNYSWEFEGKEFSITIKAGFQTDLASVPRIFWSIIPPFGKHSAAAVIHDSLYTGNGNVRIQDGIFLLDGKEFTQKFSRDECDRLFLRICKEAGTGSIKLYTMYYALKAFGFIAWAKDKRALEKLL